MTFNPLAPPSLSTIQPGDLVHKKGASPHQSGGNPDESDSETSFPRKQSAIQPADLTDQQVATPPQLGDKPDQRACEAPVPRYQSAIQPGDLIDERTAAAILTVAVRSLRNWRALRRGPPYFKVGKRLVRYRRADVIEFLARREGGA